MGFDPHPITLCVRHCITLSSKKLTRVFANFGKLAHVIGNDFSIWLRLRRIASATAFSKRRISWFTGRRSWRRSSYLFVRWTVAALRRARQPTCCLSGRHRSCWRPFSVHICARPAGTTGKLGSYLDDVSKKMRRRSRRRRGVGETETVER